VTREEIITLLKEVVSIDVRETSSYTGGIDSSGNLYRDEKVIQLKIDGEVVSETWI
jgi:hypothetical protein